MFLPTFLLYKEIILISPRTVVTEGEKAGVKTYIVPPPLIFGRGTGSFTLGVGQVHMMTQLALKKKQSVMLGTGSGVRS